jgi:hypothetical protein
MMTRNTSGLRRGGPGRPKGIPNKITLQIKETARVFLSDPKGQRKLLEQYQRGKLHPSVLTMLYAYAFGRRPIWLT